MATVTAWASAFLQHFLLLLVLQSWLTTSLKVLYTHSEVYVQLDTSGSVVVGRYPPGTEFQNTMSEAQGSEVLRVLARRLCLLSPGGVLIEETGFQLKNELPEFDFSHSNSRYNHELGVGTLRESMSLTWAAGGVDLSLVSHLVTRTGSLQGGGLFAGKSVFPGQVVLLWTATHTSATSCALCGMAKYLQLDLIFQGHQTNDTEKINTVQRAGADFTIRYDKGASVKLSSQVLVDGVTHQAEINHTTVDRGTRVSLMFERRNVTTEFGLLLTPGDYLQRDLVHYDSPTRHPYYYSDDYYYYDDDDDNDQEQKIEQTNIESTGKLTTAKTEPQPQQSADGDSNGVAAREFPLGLCLLCPLLVQTFLQLMHFYL